LGALTPQAVMLNQPVEPLHKKQAAIKRQPAFQAGCYVITIFFSVLLILFT
jgi:hypothetical protein